MSAWRTLHVVERLARGVEHQHQVVHPGAFEDLQVVLHLVEELLLLLRVAATELGVELTAEDAGDDAARLDEEDLVAVEIGPVLEEVAVEALARPARALDMLDEGKGARAHDLGLGVARVLCQLGGAIDAVEGRRQRLHHAGHRVLQLEDDRGRIGRLHVEVLVIGLADRNHALRRGNDAVVAGLDVGGGERRAVVELDAGTDLEGVGHLVRRDGPALGQVGDDLGIVLAVELDEQRVVRGDRVDQRERGAAVAVVVGGLGHDTEAERAALLRGLRGGYATPDHERSSDRDRHPQHVANHFLPPLNSFFPDGCLAAITKSFRDCTRLVMFAVVRNPAACIGSCWSFPSASTQLAPSGQIEQRSDLGFEVHVPLFPRRVATSVRAPQGCGLWPMALASRPLAASPRVASCPQ